MANATPTTEKIEIQKFDDGSVKYVNPITLEEVNPLDFLVNANTTLREYIDDVAGG